MDGTIKKNICIGMLVDIVKKEHQPTGELTRGYVAKILTNSPKHHRGIKVKLSSGAIGRVQRIPSKKEIRLENFKFYNKFFFQKKLYSIWDIEKKSFLVVDYKNEAKGVFEKTSFLFDTFEQATSFILGTNYPIKKFPIREINRNKMIADNFSKIGTQYFRININRKLSIERIREWESYFKSMR
ncbi:YwbE family protein (plasmid) [Paenibacillus thiaminolyticus]|uniref:YwbE family protein n=1 Tax=Paenibacillus thiaminolyticus TaxID=49283 RepID=UPI00232C6F30|nr:YwbE family protein [Paenibacillus thiaminolyticus]WCF11621.1 YwbE family protein [Paenibacillus thiaminolyticus]